MDQEKKRFLAKYRDHYQSTKYEHRPVPVLVPFAAIILLVVVAFLFLDNMAAGMRGRWPAWLVEWADRLTDVGASAWVIALTTIVIIIAWSVRSLLSSETLGTISARAIAIALYVLVSVGLAALIVNIIKRAVGRPRPVMFDDHGLFSLNPFTWNFDFESFPSGHATTNGALFMALALLMPRIRYLLLLLGLCFALTRVFIGVHFPSDVTAGFGFGMWFAFATAVWFSRYGILFTQKDGTLALKT